jgi:hypothetical protein
MLKPLALSLILLSSAAQAQDSIEEVAKGIGDLFQNFWERRPPRPTPQGVGSQQERAVFLKTQGCAKASFVVAPVSPRFQVGVFAKPRVHEAWVRISSDTVPRTPDHGKSTIGFAVKLLDVPGAKVLKGEEHATTHDFLVQNHHIFFVDKAIDFLQFTKASLEGKFKEYVEAHPRTGEILNDMDKMVENVLATTYWSTVPSKFGKHGHAKYKVVPCETWTGEPPPPPDVANFLQPRLERDLLAKGACFYLQVQVRNERRNSNANDDLNPEPLDLATKEWTEQAARPQTVATILIPQQDIKENAETCERLSMTAWHALPEHKPIGSLQEARGIVYKRMADLRRKNTGAPVQEPSN